MDGPHIVLETIRHHRWAVGRVRGLFHLAIGRKLARADGTVLSTGVSWRELAQILKALKFDRELVKELGLDPEMVSPKDREKFWYMAISQAKVDSEQARREADALGGLLKPLGFVVGPAPMSDAVSSRPSQAVPPPVVEVPEQPEADPAAPRPKRKKKK